MTTTRTRARWAPAARSAAAWAAITWMGTYDGAAGTLEAALDDPKDTDAALAALEDIPGDLALAYARAWEDALAADMAATAADLERRVLADNPGARIAQDRLRAHVAALYADRLEAAAWRSRTAQRYAQAEGWEVR